MEGVDAPFPAVLVCLDQPYFVFSRSPSYLEWPPHPWNSDRAKERRDNANPDYVGTDSEIQSLHNVAPPNQATAHLADLHRITIENSKFLGGDVEHTHLVKGLDFALLQKVRSELTKKDREDEDEEVEIKKKKADEAKAAAAKMTFRTQTARTIHEILTGNYHRAIPVREQFQQGRTQFVYELGEEDNQDIPTVVVRVFASSALEPLVYRILFVGDSIRRVGVANLQLVTPS
eukprot:1193337-Prorocentrum_minimum.AAC.1